MGHPDLHAEVNLRENAHIPPICGEIDQAVEYAREEFRRRRCLHHYELIWPYEKMFRQPGAWPVLMRSLNLPRRR